MWLIVYFRGFDVFSGNVIAVLVGHDWDIIGFSLNSGGFVVAVLDVNWHFFDNFDFLDHLYLFDNLDLSHNLYLFHHFHLLHNLFLNLNYYWNLYQPHWGNTILFIWGCCNNVLDWELNKQDWLLIFILNGLYFVD